MVKSSSAKLGWSNFPDIHAYTGYYLCNYPVLFMGFRSRLSYEQFGAFLANIKELNAHRQSHEVSYICLLFDWRIGVPNLCALTLQLVLWLTHSRQYNPHVICFLCRKLLRRQKRYWVQITGISTYPSSGCLIATYLRYLLGIGETHLTVSIHSLLPSALKFTFIILMGG